MFNVSAWEASGLTIKALAEAAGVSFSTAWRWIHAGSKPSPLARKKLQKLLDLKSFTATARAGIPTDVSIAPRRTT